MCGTVTLHFDKYLSWPQLGILHIHLTLFSCLQGEAAYNANINTTIIHLIIKVLLLLIIMPSFVHPC